MQLFSSSAFKSLFSYKVAIQLSGEFCRSCLDLIQINSRVFVLSMPKAFRLNSVLVYPEKERLAHLIIEYISLYKCFLLYGGNMDTFGSFSLLLEVRNTEGQILRHQYSQFNENTWFCRVNARRIWL